MKKSDLKDGMIIKVSRGDTAMLMANRFLCGCNEGSDITRGLLGLEEISEDLTCSSIKGMDIVAVYKINDCYGYYLSEIIQKLPKNKVSILWERPREIDWSKLPRWIKVQVKDYHEEPWRNAYFIRLDDSNEDYPYKITFCDTFTLVENCICGYMQCRIHPEQEIKEEWYK